MKFLTVAVAAAAITMTQAVVFSSLAVLSLLGFNTPVYGFFGGLFRRRGSMPLEQATTPHGPIQMPSFPQRRGVFNPFPEGLSSGIVSGFRNGVFQPGFLQQIPFRQSWSSRNFPPAQSVQLQPSPAEQKLQFQQVSGMETDSQSGFNRDARFDEQTPATNIEEAESFFTLLAETDENKCISRLVCEMGADPTSAGELGATISEIIGSLTDFPTGSKVSDYNKVIQEGRSRGMSACLSKYAICDEESYGLMKNSQVDESDGS